MAGVNGKTRATKTSARGRRSLSITQFLLVITLLALTHSASAQQTKIPDLRTRTAGTDWPTFLGPTGDARSPETGVNIPADGTPPPLVWQAELGASYGSPAISLGRLFIFDRINNELRLRCLNSETGAPIWQFTYATNYSDMYGYNNGPRSSPVVDGDRVYILGVQGRLHCLRVTDGQVLWNINTSEKYHVIPNFFGVGATPTIYKNLIIVPVGGSPERSPGIQSGRVEANGTGIVAFNKMTGQEVYRIADELASYSCPVISEINGRPYAFQFARGGLIAFNPDTGDIDFHYPWRADVNESVNAANPVIGGTNNDEVFISECYGPGATLLKITPGEGDGYKVIWADVPRSRKKMQTHWMTPIKIGDYLYGSSGRHQDAELRCIEWSTGEVKWSQPQLGRCSLLLVDDHLLVLSEYGEMFVIRPNSDKFEPLAQWPLRDGNGRKLLRAPAWAAPVLSHGLLYLRGDGRLVCMELIEESKD